MPNYYAIDSHQFMYEIIRSGSTITAHCVKVFQCPQNQLVSSYDIPAGSIPGSGTSIVINTLGISVASGTPPTLGLGQTSIDVGSSGGYSLQLLANLSTVNTSPKLLKYGTEDNVELFIGTDDQRVDCALTGSDPGKSTLRHRFTLDQMSIYLRVNSADNKLHIYTPDTSGYLQLQERI